MADDYFDMLMARVKKDHPCYNRWGDYSLKAENRGDQLAFYLESFINLEGKNILDIGCGDGGISISLAKKGAKVIGLDINQEHIKLANQRAKQAGVNIEFICGDILNAYIENKFDIIILYDVIEHINDLKSLAKKINYFLNQSGILYIQFGNKFAPLSIISDPHYGLPGLTLMPRLFAEKFVVQIAKRSNTYGVSAWPSIRYLKKIFLENNIILYFDKSATLTKYKNKLNNPALCESIKTRKILNIIIKLKLSVFLEAFFTFFPPEFILIGARDIK